LDNLDKLYPFIDKKVLFVGIGNALKSDDAVGIYVCNQIVSRDNLLKIVVESGIERFVGKINRIDPDILILVDCTDFNQKPGYFDLRPVSDISDNTFNTHTISLRRISEFFSMKKFLLGIQPGYTGFGEILSPEVKKSADYIISFINSNKMEE